ncbi:hypothetical protein P1O43_001724 [Salmonella enterica]|nr:hypothetical protein [Salmonella enterica]
MVNAKYGVFFWRKGELASDVASSQNIANKGVKPRRTFSDYIEGMRYCEKLNATIPAPQKDKYEYVLSEVVEPDKNGTKDLFKSGNLTEALKLRRDASRRDEVAEMVKQGVADYLNKNLRYRK